jgi:hypothetical protein
MISVPETCYAKSGGRPQLAIAGHVHSTACHLWRDIVSSSLPATAAGPEFSTSLQRLFRAFDAKVQD